MEFSHLLLISVGEEETKPCYHPDCEKKFILIYKIYKKTATLAKKFPSGRLNLLEIRELNSFGSEGCLASLQRDEGCWVISVSYVKGSFSSIPPNLTFFFSFFDKIPPYLMLYICREEDCLSWFCSPTLLLLVSGWTSYSPWSTSVLLQHFTSSKHIWDLFKAELRWDKEKASITLPIDSASLQ